MKRLILIPFVTLLMLVSYNANSQDKAEFKDFEGTWKYFAEYAPYEYQEGEVVVYKEKNEYKAKVVIDGYEMQALDPALKDNVFTFTVNVEYETVKVTMQKKDGKMEAVAMTYEGMIPLEVTKGK